MKYDLKRPCPQCPFRSDRPPFLRTGRVAEIAEALHAGGSFSCHQTVDYDQIDGNGEDEYRPGAEEQFCAGALLVLEHEFADRGGCVVNQAARFAHRFGLFNPDDLDHDAPVYESLDEMIEAAATRGRRAATRKRTPK